MDGNGGAAADAVGMDGWIKYLRIKKKKMMKTKKE